ncbi:MAG: B12-binding domain-containing radical SAM protein [Phycisphaerae bacterium]
MKLTLIRISEMVHGSSGALTTPPVGVAYLAGYLIRHGHDVRVIDGVGEGINDYAPVFDEALGLFLHGLALSEIVDRIEVNHSGLIGVSCMFSQDWPIAKRLISQIRARFPEATIVCGGEHVSALPEHALRDSGEINYCVRREGEATLLELVDWLESAHHGSRTVPDEVLGLSFLDINGRYRDTGSRPRISDLDSIPYPAWDRVPIERYLSSGSGFGVNKGRNMPIVASRGCPYECTFCSNVDMWTRRWDARDPIQVVDEMAHFIRKYQATNFDFYDLTMVVRKDWILAFCAELERRQLNITFQLPSGTRSEAIDEEVASALKRTGCCHIVYAPESGSERTLKRVRKQIKLPRLVESMRSAVRAGTFVKANIVLGFPGDTHGDIFLTYLFLIRMAWIGVHDVFVYTFTPYPGTSLFRQLRQRGRIGELDEEYFLSLAHYIKLKETLSYTDHVTSRTLGTYRFCGLMLFYLLSFLFYPRRLFRMIWNFAHGRADTRIEQSIKALLKPSTTNTHGFILARRVKSV